MRLFLAARALAVIAGVVSAALSGRAQTAPAAFAPQRPSIRADRSGHTTTVLADGRVLLAGGRVEVGGALVWMPTAGLFDPSAGTLVATGEMVTVREKHRAVRLKDGRVLMTGGMGPAPSGGSGALPLATAEIYDPATGRFTVTGSMTRSRASHDAELLANGQVLITGGEVPPSRTRTAEVYDPRTGRFTITRANRR